MSEEVKGFSAIDMASANARRDGGVWFVLRKTGGDANHAPNSMVLSWRNGADYYKCIDCYEIEVICYPPRDGKQLQAHVTGERFIEIVEDLPTDQLKGEQRE